MEDGKPDLKQMSVGFVMGFLVGFITGHRKVFKGLPSPLKAGSHNVTVMLYSTPFVQRSVHWNSLRLYSRVA